jgi:uncharacterized protein with HEPN domain
MRGINGNIARINHIIDAILEIESYIAGAGYDKFIKNSMMRNAVIRQLEIIGEAAVYITQEYKEKHPDIEWRTVIGLRNILIHKYFGIDNELIWQIVKKDIPEFKEKIKTLLTINEKKGRRSKL